MRLHLIDRVIAAPAHLAARLLIVHKHWKARK